MARPLRIEYEGAFYHVTARGNERKKIFLSEGDYSKFLTKLTEALHKYEVVLHAYVLMGNHYHLIVETLQGNLSAFMQVINSSYTTYFNIKRKRAGHLFQGRYKAILIDADSYLLELSRYIHLNPVRAGMVLTPEQYPYSSYRAYTKPCKDTPVTCERVMEMVSMDRRKAPQLYERFVKSVLDVQDDAVADPLKKVYGGMILGTNTFIKNTLDRIKHGALHDRDVSNRKALSAAISVDEIIGQLAAYFNEPEDRIASDSPYKSYAVYFARKYTPCSNQEIGSRFGISYSAVTKIGTRLKERMAADRKLSKEIGGMEAHMSRVKG
jgi:REP element-mobilizing transposase RayT